MSADRLVNDDVDGWPSVRLVDVTFLVACVVAGLAAAIALSGDEWVGIIAGSITFGACVAAGFFYSIRAAE